MMVDYFIDVFSLVDDVLQMMFPKGAWQLGPGRRRLPYDKTSSSGAGVCHSWGLTLKEILFEERKRVFSFTYTKIVVFFI